MTTNPILTDFAYELIHDSNTTDSRWTVPDEGDANLGTNFGPDNSLATCKEICTSLLSDCKGFFWGDNEAWGGIDVCITLKSLIPKQARGVYGQSYKKVTGKTKPPFVLARCRFIFFKSIII